MRRVNPVFIPRGGHVVTVNSKALELAGITKDTPYYAGLFKRAERASALSADLFLSIHHDSVPDSFLQKWEYQGVQRSYSDRFKGHSIFISRSNGSYDASLQFARLLGNQLKARGLKYTPHYTEKFMGHRQRVLVDADDYRPAMRHQAPRPGLEHEHERLVAFELYRRFRQRHRLLETPLPRGDLAAQHDLAVDA